MSRTITSANSTFTLTATGVILAPFQVQGFATDDAFDIEDANPSEVRKGVDGRMSAGFTPFMIKQAVHLQADSTSIDLFDAILAATKSTQEVVRLDGSILVPSVGKIYTLTEGYLTRVSVIAPSKKVLEPQVYEITWNTIDIANV